MVTLSSTDRRRDRAHSVVPWVGSTPQLVARLDAVYTNDADDWHTWGFACWYLNTPAGDAIADRLPPSSLHDDDDD